MVGILDQVPSLVDEAKHISGCGVEFAKLFRLARYDVMKPAGIVANLGFDRHQTALGQRLDVRYAYLEDLYGRLIVHCNGRSDIDTTISRTVRVEKRLRVGVHIVSGEPDKRPSVPVILTFGHDLGRA